MTKPKKQTNQSKPTYQNKSIGAKPAPIDNSLTDDIERTANNHGSAYTEPVPIFETQKYRQTKIANVIAGLGSVK